MGFLRTYLAFCIVSTHSNRIFPWPIPHPPHVLQILFCISGFYMAMVLDQRYRTPHQFYVSRFLRIFGPYYAVLISVVLFSLASGAATGNWLALGGFRSPFEQNGASGVVFATVSNLTILFQDWVLFLTHPAGSAFQFTADFRVGGNPLYRYLVLPQTWTIGLELTFYLAAPWLVRLRTPTLWLVLLGSLAARLYAYYALGLLGDPFNYRFFPFELGLFIAGMLAWRAYAHLNLEEWFPTCRHPVAYMSACAVVVFVVAASHAAIKIGSRWVHTDYVTLLTYPFWAVAIVIAFAYSRRHRLDAFIGDLCYPVYLWHYSIMVALSGGVLQRMSIDYKYLGLICALVTLSISIAFVRFFVGPFERWRHRVVRQPARPDGAVIVERC